MKKLQQKLRSGLKDLKSKILSRQRAGTTSPTSDPATPSSSGQVDQHAEQNEPGSSVPQIGRLELNQPLTTHPTPTLEAQAQSSGGGEDQASNTESAKVGNKDSPEEKADCWTLALEKVNKDSRIIIKEACTKDITDRVPKNSDTKAWVEALQDEIQKLQEQYQEDKGDGAFTFWGKTFRIRSILEGLFQTLVKVMNTLEEAAKLGVSVAPAHAVGPFLLVKTLLIVSTANSTQEGALYVGLDQVLPVIIRCQEYERIIRKSLSDRPHQQMQGFRNAVVALCVCVLDFLCAAHRIRLSNRLKRTYYALWNPEAIVDFGINYRRLEEDIEREANVNQCLELGRLGAVIESKIWPLISDISETIGAFKARLDDSAEALQKDKRNKVLKWASEENHVNHHEKLKEHRAPNTCNWILERAEFQVWQASPGSKILWVNGIPGAGKTRLVTRIIDHLKVEQPSKLLNRRPLAYFYCKKGELGRDKPVDVLSSYVRQLASQAPDAFAILYREYMKMEPDGFSSNQLSTAKYETMLKEIVAFNPDTLLILDALDECSEYSNLVQTLRSLVTSGFVAKILISSRRDQVIERLLNEEETIDIRASDNENDIRTYVLDYIKTHHERGGLPISTDLQDKISNTFQEKSKGMFLWTELQLKRILPLELSVRQIERQLDDLVPGNLSTGMNDVFRGLLANIESNCQLGNIGRGALMWLISQGGECLCETLLGALEFDPKNAAGYNGTPECTNSEVLTACQNLVEEGSFWDEIRMSYSTSFRFIHLSVQDYLEGLESWSKPRIHTFAAELCLYRLLDPERVSNRSSFSAVAARQWTYHAQIADRAQAVPLNPKLQEPNLRKLLREFLGTSGTVPWQFTFWQEKAASSAKKVSTKWLSLAVAEVRTSGHMFMIPCGNNAIKPHSVDVACYLGLESTFDSMLTQTPKTCFDFRQVTSLIRSKDRAFDQCFLVLSPATTSDMLCRYLQMATQITGVPPLDTLWNVMVEAMMHMHKWYSSSEQQKESLRSGLAQTVVEAALQLPSFSRDELALLLLATLKLVPEPYPHNRDHRRAQIATWGALADAAEELDTCRHPEEFLKSSRHDRCLGSTAMIMQAAQSSSGEDVFVQEFESLRIGLIAVLGALPRGGTADPSRQCFDAVTDAIYVLIHATHGYIDARESSWKALETILSSFAHKTDAILREKLLSPFLVYALMYHKSGSEKACRMLLSAGAQDGNHVTIGRLTRRSRTAKTAETLRMIYDQTPGPSIRYLYTVGNKAEAKRTDSGKRNPRTWTTALMASSVHRRDADKRCDLLLNHGAANINAIVTGKYGTVLIAACARGDREVCAMLLARGANPNLLCFTGPYRTALIASCSCGHMSRGLSDLLLSHGADVNFIATEGRYGTALIAACAHGDVDVAQTLLAEGANPNTVCSTGPFRTALIAACAWEHCVNYYARSQILMNEVLAEDRKRSVIRARMCSLLLDYGAEANTVVHGGHFRTALIAASRSDDVDNCVRLIKAGADVNQCCAGDYTSPLTAARVVTSHVLERTIDESSFVNRAVIYKKMNKHIFYVARGKTHQFLSQHSATDSGFLGAAADLYGLFEV